jgi:L-serine dehydratase
MFYSFEQIVDRAEATGLSISEISIQTEVENTGIDRTIIWSEMEKRLIVMKKSMHAGVSKPVHSLSGLLRGNAFKFSEWLKTKPQPVSGKILGTAVARAMAVGEVNASMGCIVATPTAGSAGVLPAVLTSIQDAFQLSDDKVIRALFTAGQVGRVIMSRAHVSGAAGGCQAETGSAAAMAAAAGVELLGGSPRQSAHALAIALQNMLGLVCDPIAGLVEVPCVLRNAGATAQSMVAIDLALAGITSLIPSDEVIDAMGRVGNKMDERLKETAQGGLATSPTGKAISDKIWNPVPESSGGEK